METNPTVKIEPSSEEATSGQEDKLVSDQESQEKKVHFVQVKNRQVFDYEPNANSIHASMWPHWWLKSVKSKHMLRRKEAAKNVRFKTGLNHLFQEALEVRTITKFLIFDIL